MHRDFKGVWIPKHIWLNKDLSIMEKLFLVEIDSLDQSEGCFASNAHFSEMFSVTKGRCSQIIRSLEEKNLVTIKLEKEGKRVVKRLIRVVNKLNYPIKKTKQPYLENAQGNNTPLIDTKGGREARALSFLESEYPSRYEQEFLMAYKSEIKDFKKFAADFNDTVDQEDLFYSGKVLFARLGKYARNWIQNQNKYGNQEETVQPAYRRKIS